MSKEHFNPQDLAEKIICPPIVLSLMELSSGLIAEGAVGVIATQNRRALEFFSNAKGSEAILAAVTLIVDQFSQVGISPTITLSAIGLISAAAFIDGAQRVQRTMGNILNDSQ